MRKTTVLFLALVLAGLFLAQIYADGGNSGDSRKSIYAPIQALIEDEQYERALIELEKALKNKADDPNLLNLYAYSNRKLSRYETALSYYQKALAIDPEHRGANEYLGELYLLLGEPEKAEERLQVLDRSCFFGCEEFDELEQAIAKYRKQNPA
jgi:Flp pilus assembly protein TadD